MPTDQQTDLDTPGDNGTADEPTASKREGTENFTRVLGEELLPLSSADRMALIELVEQSWAGLLNPTVNTTVDLLGRVAGWIEQMNRTQRSSTLVRSLARVMKAASQADRSRAAAHLASARQVLGLLSPPTGQKAK